ncbi:hypothetical protein AB0K16_53725 [Nonomuraea jabiensis]|uniref:hypothetical protein n=1 Tax=Nonomuraea jabiensis TaxID=882448 RepID=UPI0034322F32
MGGQLVGKAGAFAGELTATGSAGRHDLTHADGGAGRLGRRSVKAMPMALGVDRPGVFVGDQRGCKISNRRTPSASAVTVTCASGGDGSTPVPGPLMASR